VSLKEQGQDDGFEKEADKKVRREEDAEAKAGRVSKNQTISLGRFCFGW
jgi:hypothetical protein